jgi:Flp pilus assembly protein, ATPase CpaF
VQRLPDGQRRVISIGEITGMEGEVVQMHEIFRFVKERTDDKATFTEPFRATGIRPTFLDDLKHMRVGPSAEPLRSKSSFVTAMIPTELWLIYALVFGAVLLGFQGIYWVLFKERREKQAINRRLALTAELANPKEVLEILRKERGVDLAPIPALQSFKELVVQSGVRWTGVKLLLVAAVPTILFFLLFRLATGSSFLAITLAGLLAAASIYLFLAIRPTTPDRRIQ